MYMLQELRRQVKMKSGFFCVACLFLVFTAISEAEQGCDRETGPAGVAHCFLNSPYYSKYQCATCLTNVYIKQRSKGKYQCRDTTATYCHYQCMVEKYGLDSGPVYDDCLCDPDGQLAQPSVILPASCYSPAGTDCHWYRQCLAKMFDCTGQAEYAISYGEKFCNLYEQSKSKFSQKGLQWIDATRKCLQVALVPFLHICRLQPTCEDIESTAFDSHVDCYLNPYAGFSVCYIPPKDWCRIVWTIKGSFVSSAFLETIKASLIVGVKCPLSWISDLGKILGNILFSMDVRVKQGNVNKRAADAIMSDDELAHSIVFHISSSLHWDQQSTIDWFAFAANTSAVENPLTTSSTDQNERKLRIQVIGFNF